jgi:hypothetical protein
MPRIGKEIAGFGALIVKNASKSTCRPFSFYPYLTMAHPRDLL